MRTRFTIATLALAMAAAAVPGLAHHSFDAIFDTKKPVTVTGTVTKIDWGNPHIWFHVTATDGKGAKAAWSFESHSPNLLIRVGWKKTTMKVGDDVVVKGSHARDGSNRASTSSVIKTDGTVIYNGLRDTVSEK